MYKDYSSLVQFQLDKIKLAQNVNLNTSISLPDFMKSNSFVILTKTLNSLKGHLKIAKDFSDNPTLLKSINNAVKLQRQSLNFEKIKIDVKFNRFDVSDFSRALFSEESPNFIKESLETDEKVIDDAFSLLRYEYVKNTLVNAKSIRRIKWEPIAIGFRKYIAQFQTDNIQNNSNNDKKIQDLSPHLSALISSMFLDDLNHSLKSFVTFLANEFLPFLPLEIRNSMLLLIIFIIAFNKLDKD